METKVEYRPPNLAMVYVCLRCGEIYDPLNPLDAVEAGPHGFVGGCGQNSEAWLEKVRKRVQRRVFTLLGEDYPENYS